MNNRYLVYAGVVTGDNPRDRLSRYPKEIKFAKFCTGDREALNAVDEAHGKGLYCACMVRLDDDPIELARLIVPGMAASFPHAGEVIKRREVV